MKFLIIFTALLAVALAAPRPDAEIVRQDSDVQPDGFKFDFETSDGTSHNAQGQLKDLGKEHAIVVHGTFSWIDKNGQKFTVTYVADENGFQPSGAHLP